MDSFVHERKMIGGSAREAIRLGRERIEIVGEKMGCD